ncbi:MAG: LysM peptidoglycan-binding domain-containing protein [Lachnospiraceae bacterium]|nr:LysM peptidoglycan-binding domain-containing protein [Lachnospiraceae bacterium]
MKRKVLTAVLICICAFWLWPWNKAAIVCYAKTDTDKEKVEEFVTAYYEAHTEEGIETLPDYVEDAKSAAEEMMVLEVCLELGVEKYGNLDVTAYPLGDGIRWLAVVSYELIVEDFDIGIPGLTTLTVRKQKDGAFKIYDEYLDDMDDTEREKLEEEIWELALSDEIYDKTIDVNAGYNTVVSENPDILEWVLELQDEITQAHVDRMEDISQPETAKTKTYIVRKGDCLWSIAEEEFGDGMYWSRIYEANRELIGDTSDLLYVGWELNMDIPVETVYTDEECKEITFGNIKCSISKFYHIARVVEEENQTTFYAEADSKPDEPGFHGPQQRIYIVRKEPELPDSYEEAIKYFEGITELSYFKSYQTADDNKIRALYKAMEADEDKAYYLVGVSGEDGLYFIETEDILLDNSLAVLYGRKSPFVEEYCYTLSDVKCGRNYTAQVEKNIYYGEMRAEYKVTSDLLNYTAEFSAVPSEDDESKLVNTWNVTLENEPYKVPTVQWVSEALTRFGYLDYPDFDDMNADGYPDLLGYVYTPHGSRSMKTIFVWDEQEQKYVQVIKVGDSKESEWPNTFCSPHASDDRVEEWHIKYEDMIETVHYYCYRWEGNKLILDDEDEYTLVYDMEKDMYVREDEE